MSFDLFPPLGDDRPKKFAADPKMVDRLAILMGLYTLLVLYPAYALLRWLWTGHLTVFEPSGIATAIVIAVLFGLFARRTMRQYAFIKTRR